MRVFVTLLFCLIYSFSIRSQEPRIIEIYKQDYYFAQDFWKNVELTKFRYNNNGNLSYHSFTDWDSSNKIREHSEKQYFYNEYGQQILVIDSTFRAAEWADSVEDVIRVSHHHFFYDETGVLQKDSIDTGSPPRVVNEYSYHGDKISQVATYHYFSNIKSFRQLVTYLYQDGCIYEKRINKVLGPDEIYRYQTYSDCSIKEELFQRQFDVSGLQNEHRYTYDYDEKGLITYFKSEDFNYSQNHWETTNIEWREYSSTGKLVKLERDPSHPSSNNNIFLFFDYDDKDSLVRVRQRTIGNPTNTFRYHTLDSIYYKYDENNFLIWKEDFNFNEDNSNIPFKIATNYLNYCDGLPRIVLTDRLDLNKIKRVSYKYENLTDCQEDKQSQNLKIFPNPTTGLIKIESNLLSAQNNQVNIYSTDGRFLRTAKVDFRTEEMTLDLSDLSNGIYFIEVKNKGGRLTEKIVISK